LELKFDNSATFISPSFRSAAPHAGGSEIILILEMAVEFQSVTSDTFYLHIVVCHNGEK
jgi:hypothetical protein